MEHVKMHTDPQVTIPNNMARFEEKQLALV